MRDMAHTRRPGRSVRHGAGVAALAVLLPGLVLAAPGPAAAAEAPPLTTGGDALGQQGNGAAGARTSPGAVDGPAATAVASGRDTGYLLAADGRVWAWGDNAMGQVGDGTTTRRQSPVRLGLTDVVALEAGHYHGLAVRADGSLWTWGYGSLGQLGLGTTANRTTPTQVPGLSAVVAAVGGRDMSYALTASGTVLAWGSNTNGELGDGTTTSRTSPVAVPGLSGVVEIAAGRNHAVALDSDGGVWAWGDNAYGQVGNGTTVDVRRPVRVATGVATVDAGAQHTLAVRADGTVASWGRGYRGALGLGSTANRTVPTTVPGLSGVVEAGDGRDQSFAVTSAGRVWAWGNNDQGQLGDGTTTLRTSPVLLPVEGIADAASGAVHTVFLRAATTAPRPPTASFAASCSGLSCTLDASASVDPDGPLTGYAWDLGDGATATGVTVQHTWPQAGTVTVALTVTDADGLTATTTRELVLSEPTGGAVEHVATVGSNANAISHRVTIPPGVAQGDELVLVITVNTSTTVADPSGLTGWTRRTAVAGSDVQSVVWTRTAGAGDVGRTVTVTLGAQSKAALALGAYRAPAGAEVTEVLARAETTSTASHTTPAVTVARDGSTLVSVWSDKSSATTSMTAPAGTAVRLLSTGSSGGRITLLWADAAAGVGPAGGLTAVASSASSKATMISVVIGPR